MKSSKKKLKIAVLGTQASGKGTQTHIISITQNIPAVSMGNLLRDVTKEDSDRGRAVKAALDVGGFPPEAVVMSVLKEWTNVHPDGWVIDGFPRTIAQAQHSAPFFRPDVILFLEVADEEAKRRISYRRICSKCKTNYNVITQPPKNSKGVCDVCGGELIRRPDDTPELVTERLRQYHEMTAPLKEWYKSHGGVIEIDARQGIKEVAHDIDVQLGAFKKRHRRWHRAFGWLIGLALTVVAVLGLLIYTGSNL